MRLLILLLSLCFLAACEPKKQKPDKDFVPLKGYDLNHPLVLKLPLQLDEISGLAWVEKDNTLLSINDEHGILYKVDVRRPNHIQQWRFGPADDYEGVAVTDSMVYVLISDGSLLQIHFKNQDTILTQKFPFPTEGNEFESLTYLKATNSLLMVCKSCGDDDKDEFSWFQFSLDSLQFTGYRYRFPVSKIEAVLNYSGKKFKPSGMAVNPKNGHFYLVSAVNKTLVVISQDMQVMEAVPLTGHLFLQPEGIDFDNAGNMFISNESNKVQAANILIFPNRTTN